MSLTAPIFERPRFRAKDGSWHAALRTLHLRNPDAPAYALREYEMHGFYMRNMLAHAMCVMEGGGARLVQAFTSPGVYGEMWSLHPAARNDRVYGHALSILSAEAAATPWARTNRALRSSALGRGVAAHPPSLPKWAGKRDPTPTRPRSPRC